ncbi:MAG: hypothetical protein NC124_18750 [Clostridium sp.]|nr:hypothetical protein [Clostridium sp.]MCM1541439.1 hypothetical protein [Blautia sp.]
MNKTFVCDVSEEAMRELLDIFEMKSTLESLIMQIAGNNDILKEDSLLYSELVKDYKECMKKYSKVWHPYFEKYGHMLGDNSEFTVDYKYKKLYIVPVRQENTIKE